MARPGLSFEVAAPSETVAVRADRGGLAALMQRGPTDRLVSIESPEQLAAVFGCPTPGMLGARAAQAFFDNGGAQLWVARIVPPSATAATSTLSLLGVVGPAPSPTVTLTEPGAFGDDVRVRPRLRLRRRFLGTVDAGGTALTTSEPPSAADVGQPVLLLAGGAQAWTVLGAIAGGGHALTPARAALGDASVVAEVYEWAFDLVIEEPSRADVVLLGVDLRDPQGTADRLAGAPLALDFTATDDLPVPDVASLSGGRDGLEPGDLALDAATFRAAFDRIDASDAIDLVFCPDLWSRIYETKGFAGPSLPVSTATELGIELIRRAAMRRDRVALIDPPLVGHAPMAPSELLEWRASLDAALGADRDYGVAYAPWPRVVVDFSLRGDDTLLVPPSAFVAGQLARTAIVRGPWVATGGVALIGPVGLSQRLTGDQEQALGEQGINPLRASSAGVTIEGVRALAHPDRVEWRYYTARRLMNYLRRALVPLGLSYVFEPNGPATWIQLRRDVEAMLREMFARGAFAGSRPQDGFFVKVDEALNPPEARETGALTAQIGVAPAVPLEFLVVSLVLEAREVSVVEGAR
ncbi:MAG: phage tail sheath family protein [Myxococcales bacterium]|nr:phage tail sheath family protein [Myxococcales bacterium]